MKCNNIKGTVFETPASLNGMYLRLSDECWIARKVSTGLKSRGRMWQHGCAIGFRGRSQGLTMITLWESEEFVTAVLGTLYNQGIACVLHLSDCLFVCAVLMGLQKRVIIAFSAVLQSIYCVVWQVHSRSILSLCRYRKVTIPDKNRLCAGRLWQCLCTSQRRLGSTWAPVHAGLSSR